MVLEIKNIRYAHGAGHTDVCYGFDNRHILTCGSDGNVRVWNGSDDDDPSADFVAETALAVACSRDHIYVATDNNYVQAFTYPDCKRDKVLFRFSAPVTYICLSSSGKYIAACSCDMEIQLLDTEKDKITSFIGHTAPVLGISLDPLGEYIVSCSCDGTVKIWNILSGSLVKTFHDVIPVKNDFFKAECLGRPAWKSISGTLLAIPKDKEVILYKRGTWDVTFKLMSGKIQKLLSVVMFSPCGNYVAAASTAGEIIIWEIKHKSEVCFFEDPKKVGISGIAWHPDGSEMALCDRLGRLCVLTGINEEISKHVVPIEKHKGGNIEYESQDELNDLINGNILLSEDEEEDDENCISLEKIKADYKNLSDGECPGSPSSITSKSSETLKEETFSPPKPQFPFQPTSTPSHFEPRCLCYNTVGLVRYYDSDKTIDVQFHDTMFHHALFLRSFGPCTMAALSMSVLCLAVPSIETNLSKLSCLPLSSWAGSKEWTVYMPENENIIALAAGGSWVAAATNCGHMRIFTYAGIQKQIVALPGPVVCMSGYEQTLLVVCHMGMGLIESQNLGFILYQISNLTVRAANPLQPFPISPKSFLKWVGFSDEGTPCSFDSQGILRILGQDLLLWFVACDTKYQKKSSSDNYFIIGLSEKYQNIRCILCRNSCYPLLINTPTVLEIPLKTPLCELDTDKSVQEETFWRLIFSLQNFVKLSDEKKEYLADVSSFEQTLKQTALKLFADACRNSEDLRALDIATFMSSHPLEVAVKYASKVGKMYLAEKLNGIMPVNWKDQDGNPENDDAELSRLTGMEKGEHDSNINKAVYSQQDLFDDFPTNVEKENRLTKHYVAPENPSNSIPGIESDLGVNPFKKSHSEQKQMLKGLKFFDSLERNSPKLPNETSFQNKPLKLKLGGHNNEKTSESIKKPAFVQWFSTRKNSLLKEYPNISASELTKVGMKIYKEEMSTMNNQTEKTIVAEPDLAKSQKKRKYEEASKVELKRRKSSEDFACD